MAEIIIVNYGMGNLGSVFNMFKKVGAKAKISDDLNEIEKAEKILLPGVGAFDAAMQRINESGLLPILNYKALEQKIPILGICLGMQLLTNRSQEGNLKGLGWVKAETKKFQFTPEQNLKIPHMGWNKVKLQNNSPLIHGIDNESKFYFVHSYYVDVANQQNSLTKTFYGQSFDSIITNGSNIYGAQFHPEKSHKYGMQLFKNFATI